MKEENNNESCLLTIVIPCYNMGKYLTRCLQSIVDEGLDNVEVICVNDGSTDDTLQVFHDFTHDASGRNLYPRMRMESYSNAGLSQTRNRGVRLACGEYVTFVDPDDKVVKGGLTAMLSKAVDAHLPDMVMGGLQFVADSGEVLNFGLSDELIEGNRNVVTEIYGKYDWMNWGSACGKFLKRTIIMDNDLTYVSGLGRHEDVIFNAEYFRHTGSCLTCSEMVYYYEPNENSATRNFKGEKELAAMEQCFNVLRRLYNDYFQGEEFSERIDEVNHWEANEVLNLIYQVYLSSQKCHRYHYLRKLWRYGQARNSGFTEYYRYGLPRRIAQLSRFSLLPVHLMLLVVKSIPRLRRHIEQ